MNNRQETPLHIALKKGNLEISNILLGFTNPTIKDSDGNSALHLIFNDSQILNLFLNRIINIDKEEVVYSSNRQSRTPFDLLFDTVDHIFSRNSNDGSIDR